MLRSLESEPKTEKIRHPLPIPRNFREQCDLDKRKEKILNKQIRKNNYKKSLGEEISSNRLDPLYLFRKIVLTREELREFKITRDEVEEI
jgi:hypothetical protein